MYRVDDLDPELAADAWVAYGFLHDVFAEHRFTIHDMLAQTKVTEAEVFLLRKVELLEFDGTFYRLKYGAALRELNEQLERGEFD